MTRVSWAHACEWRPPLPDPSIDGELLAALLKPLGPEAQAELELVLVPAELTHGNIRCRPQLLVSLPALARVVDWLFADPSTVAMAGFAAVCSRFFCACHLVRLAAVARQLQRVERALRFRHHADFCPAALELDEEPMDLEAAEDIFDLSQEDVKALMTHRRANTSCIEAARGINVLLIKGQRVMSTSRDFTGDWTCDRQVFDVSLLLPLMGRNPLDAGSYDLARLRADWCALRRQVVPQAVLSGEAEMAQAAAEGVKGGLRSKWHSAATMKPQNKSFEMSPAARKAAAAVLQWVWFHISLRELGVVRPQGSDVSDVGLLERQLLLQPSLSSRRLERHLPAMRSSADKFRSEPLFRNLLLAWRHRCAQHHADHEDLFPKKRNALVSGRPLVRSRALVVWGSSFDCGDGRRGRARRPPCEMAAKTSSGLVSFPAASQPQLAALARPMSASGLVVPVSVSRPTSRQGTGRPLQDFVDLKTNCPHDACELPSRLSSAKRATSAGAFGRSGLGTPSAPTNISLRQAMGLPVADRPHKMRPQSFESSESFVERPVSTTCLLEARPEVRPSFAHGGSMLFSALSGSQDVNVPKARPRSAPSGLPWVPSGMPWVTPLRC